MPAGILHVQRLLALDATRAATSGAALLHHFARAATRIAGAADAEEALLEHQLPGTAATRAGFGRVPSRAPDPLQVSHGRIFGIWIVVSLTSSSSLSSTSSV